MQTWYHGRNDQPSLVRRAATRGALVLVIAGVIAALMILSIRLAGGSGNFMVTAVLDGDTFIVDWKGQAVQIQLAGVDAPEIHKNEAFSIEAWQFLADHIQGRQIRLEALNVDRKQDYKGRRLCWAYVNDLNISHELIARGLARFSGAAQGQERIILLALESQAKNNHRGLWGQLKQAQARTAGMPADSK